MGAGKPERFLQCWCEILLKDLVALLLDAEIFRAAGLRGLALHCAGGVGLGVTETVAERQGVWAQPWHDL